VFGGARHHSLPAAPPPCRSTQGDERSWIVWLPPFDQLVWADGGYSQLGRQQPCWPGRRRNSACSYRMSRAATTSRVSRCSGAGGWLNEPFGWLVRDRRLARDYSNSEAMIKLATIRLMAIQPAGQTRALVQRHRTRSRSSTHRGDSTRSVITHIPSLSGDQSPVIP
jgi:hypothetical protein